MKAQGEQNCRVGHVSCLLVSFCTACGTEIYNPCWCKPWLPPDVTRGAHWKLLQPLGTPLPRAAAAPSSSGGPSLQPASWMFTCCWLHFPMPLYLFYSFKPWLPADVTRGAHWKQLQPLGTLLPGAATAPSSNGGPSLQPASWLFTC